MIHAMPLHPPLSLIFSTFLHNFLVCTNLIFVLESREWPSLKPTTTTSVVQLIDMHIYGHLKLTKSNVCMFVDITMIHKNYTTSLTI